MAIVTQPFYPALSSPESFIAADEAGQLQRKEHRRDDDDQAQEQQLQLLPQEVHVEHDVDTMPGQASSAEGANCRWRPK